jgi:L-arabinokinase
MYRIVRGSTHGLSDLHRFVEALDDGRRSAGLLFDPAREVIVARAPGRLDLMGGIADYSGSLVLQLPIAESVIVAVQPDPSPTITIVSLGSEPRRLNRDFSMPLGDFAAAGGQVDYESAREYFNRDESSNWAAYVAGAFLVLMRELGVRFGEGARIIIDSRVPEGKGVSSSAAIEVAAMQAIAEAFHVDMAPRDLALLCQKVENLVVGAPCGVMDQMSAVFGEAGSLLALLCQPAELQGTVTIPDDIAVWGIDSGVRHYVSGTDYMSVRVGAFMGYRMIAQMAGLKATQTGTRVVIDDSRWQGYLANVTPSEFEREFAQALPERIGGREFLERFGGISDLVTRVVPESIYAVRTPTAHPIYEHFRVQAFRNLLLSSPGEQQMAGLGNLMYESHASYSECGLGSQGTDLLVTLVREAGPRSGLYGAKITGGGSGGTVAVLGRGDAGDSVDEIAAEYERRSGKKPQVFSGSSPGASTVGVIGLACGKEGSAE